MKLKKIVAAAVLALVLTSLIACAAQPTPTPAPTPVPTRAAPTAAPTATVVPPTPTPAPMFPLTITDGSDRKVTLAKQPQRVISIAPSNTEILYAIGQGSKVVAVDDYSDFPAEAKALPKVGGLKMNFEQIVAQNPDLVLAASITPAENIKKLEELKLTVVVVGTQKRSIEGVMNDIALVGQVMGASDKATQVTKAMQTKLDALKAKVAAAKTRPKVFWEIDATDPTKPWTIGPRNFVNDILTLAGGQNIFANASSPFPQVGSEQIVAANPEIIILSDVYFGVTVESVKARKGWNVIDAVKNNKVFPIDDNLVSRPGPRVVDGLEAAMKLIQPDLFK